MLLARPDVVLADSSQNSPGVIIRLQNWVKTLAVDRSCDFVDRLLAKGKVIHEITQTKSNASQKNHSSFHQVAGPTRKNGIRNTHIQS